MMRSVLIMLAVVLLAGCAVGPDYERPNLDLPQSKFASTLLSPYQEKQLAYWWTRYQDPVLNRLINQALDSNLNIELQFERVRQARAELGLANAQFYPTISAQGQAARQRSLGSSSSGSSGSAGGSSGASGASGASGGSGGTSAGGSTGSGGGPTELSIFSISGMLNYQLDVFGALRRADQQARARLLSTAYTQDSIRLTVVSDVVTNYVSLRSLERQIRVTRQTIQTRRKALQLDQQRYKFGAIDKLTLLQTKSLLQSARAQLPPLRQQAETLRTSLAILTGRTPRQIMQHTEVAAGDFGDLKLPEEIPKFLPSALVARRPDIRAAEATLIAANANVGVAKARFFPNFNLSAMIGLSELYLNPLSDFVGPYRESSAAGTVASPILDFGRNNAQYRSAVAQKRQAEIQYRQTVRQAFKGVRDALAEIKYTSQRLQAVQDQLAAYKETLRLARIRYQVGRTNFFNVLDAQRNVFNTQLNLATAIRNRFTANADLYNALGGGWTENSDSLTPDMQQTMQQYDRQSRAEHKAGADEMAN